MSSSRELAMFRATRTSTTQSVVEGGVECAHSHLTSDAVFVDHSTWDWDQGTSRRGSQDTHFSSSSTVFAIYFCMTLKAEITKSAIIESTLHNLESGDLFALTNRTRFPTDNASAMILAIV